MKFEATNHRYYKVNCVKIFLTNNVTDLERLDTGKRNLNAEKIRRYYCSVIGSGQISWHLKTVTEFSNLKQFII